MTRAIFILFFIWFCAAVLRAQDPQFSQFYSQPLYVAPSFAGTTDGSRVSANYRDQWPGISGRFITYTLSFDHYFHRIKSGVGLLALRDQAGGSTLATNSLAAMYSYNLQLSRKWVARPGVQFSYSQRTLNGGNLLYGDQLNFNGNAPVSQSAPPVSNTDYLDFGTSAIFYSSKYWTGVGVEHLLKPNQSIAGGESIIPLRYSLFAGAKYRISSSIGRSKEESISLSALYKSQGKFDQLDIGGYWFIDPLILGLRYRGLPIVKRYENFQSNESIIFVLGLKHKGLNVGYSYDLVISRLRSTTGAHEISLSYWFNQGPPKRKVNIIFPCPEF